MPGWGRGDLQPHAEPGADLGLSEWACPECGAHLYQPDKDRDRFICLNSCHLTQYGLPSFGEVYKTAMRNLPTARGKMW